MDNLNGYVLQYQQNDDENLMIEIPDDQMSDFLIQFSQEVYDAKAVFGRKGWCITAAVTLLSAAIAYFVSGKALEPLKKLAQQAERIDQDSLVEVRLEENTIPEFRDLSQSVNRMLDRLAHSFDLQRQFAGNAAHELKTPLAIMQAKLEMFAEEHPDATARSRPAPLSDGSGVPPSKPCPHTTGNERSAVDSARGSYRTGPVGR